MKMTASSFSVTLAKLPGISDDDRHRRLTLAFDLLLAVADRRQPPAEQTTGEENAGKLAQPACCENSDGLPEGQQCIAVRIETDYTLRTRKHQLDQY